MKHLLTFPLLSLMFATQGCGAKNAKKTLATISTDNFSEFGSQSANEAISAASAGDSEGASGFSLSGLELGSPFKSSTKTCSVQADGSALVTISSELNVDKSSANSAVSRKNTMTGTSTETRTWTHTGGVQCAGDHAKINLKSDPTGYGLKIHIERSRQHTVSQTNLKKNTTVNSSRSYSMTGDREVTITSYTEDSASGTSIQIKNITGNMNRTFSFVDKAQQTQSGSFSSTTGSDKPMVVKVTRSLANKEVISREIVSGMRKNTLSDGTSVQLSFSNFLMSGAGENCEAQSGSVSIAYLDSEGTAGKTLSCSANAGELSCTDQTGAVVDLESPSCDPADDK